MTDSQRERERVADPLPPGFRLNAPTADDAVSDHIDDDDDVVVVDPDPEDPNVIDRSEPSSTLPSTRNPTETGSRIFPTRSRAVHSWGSFRQQLRQLSQTNRKLVWVIICLIALLLAAIIVIIILAVDQSDGNGTTAANPGDQPSVGEAPPFISALSTIRQRGMLNCGIVAYPGFAAFNTTTNKWGGFEVDLCRAVGAALFEEDDRVTFTNVNNGDRFNVLQSQEVDVLAAAVTYTMERDVYEPTAQAGFTFSVPYLYSGLSFAGQAKYVTCADQHLTTGNCSGLEICVLDNTTHVDIVTSLVGGSVIKLAPALVDFYNDFVAGHCNVLAGEQFDLAEINVRQAGYSGSSYSYSSNLYSKEPLALVTRDDDPEWSDFVNWVFLALLTAENKTITQETAMTAITNPTSSVDKSLIWSYYAVATVGNYAEMYARHLQSLVPRPAVNQQNNGKTPLIYSYPFGNTATVGPDPIPNGTLAKILQRGYLLCGTDEVAFFANFNRSTQEWTGFDVDYCRAISAAIFNGKGSTLFVPITGTSRWELLKNGDIDLISWDTTWNYERDVNESSTNVGFSFTIPNLFTGIQFGGVPPYGTCADSLEVSSSPCKGLKICVNNGTTTIDNIRKLFPEQFIIPVSTDDQVYACLGTPLGNAIGADDFLLVSEVTVRQYYNGSYQAGSVIFSRENLALATRQDDSQWSSFVNWVVMATFYADEQNITQATYDLMPTTNLFGQGFSTMLQIVIQAIGSHSEIIVRNAAGEYNFSEINFLNTNPLRPQHFPPGGIFGLV